jgi:thiosulfate dehydrogenase [quinone] large subunit
MEKHRTAGQLNAIQLTFLVITRVLIGWHFLFEGLSKLLNPNWSSLGYLMDSKGFMAGFYHSIAANPGTLEIIDTLNTWGLIAIGLGLVLGLLTRWATIFGVLLLALYYFSHPPFIGYEYAIPSGGSYFIVDKTLIELFTLLLLFVFPTGKIIGLDRLIFRKKARY